MQNPRSYTWPIRIHFWYGRDILLLTQFTVNPVSCSFHLSINQIDCEIVIRITIQLHQEDYYYTMFQAVHLNCQAVNAMQQEDYGAARELLQSGISLVNASLSELDHYDETRRRIMQHDDHDADEDTRRNRQGIMMDEKTNNIIPDRQEQEQQDSEDETDAVVPPILPSLSRIVSDDEIEDDDEDMKMESADADDTAASSDRRTTLSPPSDSFPLLKLQAVPINSSCNNNKTSSSSSGLAVHLYSMAFLVHIAAHEDDDNNTRRKQDRLLLLERKTNYHTNRMLLHSTLQYNLGLCLQEMSLLSAGRQTNVRNGAVLWDDCRLRSECLLILLQALASYNVAIQVLSDLENQEMQADGECVSLLDLQQSLHLRLATLNNEATIYADEESSLLYHPHDAYHSLSILRNYICSPGTYSLWMRLEDLDEASMLFFVENIRRNHSNTHDPIGE